MATTDRPTNLLALAVLSMLTERPMHPYEISVHMRHRGHDQSIKFSRGSIYTVVQALERDGLVEAQETSREGKRPERTVYAITPTGAELVHDWLCDILANPRKEYPEFNAALMMVAHIQKDEITGILEARLERLTDQLEADRIAHGHLAGVIPRIFRIETEYEDALRDAEITWLRKTIAEIKGGGYPWPLVVDGQLTWPDGDETFQPPDMPLEEWAELAIAKEGEGKSTE